MNPSHHANLCLVNNVQEYSIPEFGMAYEVQDRYFEKFTISDAKNLIHNAYNRPSNADILCLVVRTDYINMEAQHALLKVLEEPPESSKFIFILPADFTLIPTLTSRFNLIQSDPHEVIAATEEFTEFRNSCYKDRLERVAEAIKSKDVSWQRAIKSGLIHHLHKQGKDEQRYSELEFTAKTLLTHGASNKMLLEYLSLLLRTR